MSSKDLVESGSFLDMIVDFHVVVNIKTSSFSKFLNSVDDLSAHAHLLQVFVGLQVKEDAGFKINFNSGIGIFLIFFVKRFRD